MAKLLLALSALILSFSVQASSVDVCRDAFLSTSPFTEFFDKVPQDQHMTVEVKPLVDGAESLAAKIALIEKAQKSIDMSYYIFKNDASGKAILHALSLAVSRGVKVRLLVDGAGSYSMAMAHFRSLLALNKNQNAPLVEIKVINPIFSLHNTFNKLLSLVSSGEWLFDPIAANNRSHDKILLIDVGTKDSWAVLGGRNIQNHYYGVDNPATETIDYEVLLKGGASLSSDPLATIESHYNVMFTHELNLQLSRSVFGVFPVRSQRRFRDNLLAQQYLESIPRFQAHLAAMRKDAYWKSGFETSRSVLVSEIQNVVKEYQIDFKDEPQEARMNITSSVSEALRNAKHSFEVISPYALLSEKSISEVEKWLLENPNAEFILYTNSLEATNQVLAYAVFKYQTLPMLERLARDPRIGSRLKVYLSQRFLHAKVIVIDDQSSLVSTSNLDPRGENLNSEIGVWEATQVNQQGIAKLRQDLIASSILLDQRTQAVEPAALTKKQKFKQALLHYAYRTIRALNLEGLF